MACIKSVNRSSSVALAPDAPYMAAGTMAGAVDLSFSSSAALEIFKLDFQSEDHDLPLVGEVQSSERFTRLAWGRNGSGSDQYSLGLLGGGLVDGNIYLWNPSSLIRSEPSENALVGHLSNHKGPVRGLEFNNFTPNLLASGADDGEICIWDLAAPAEPSRFPPLKGSGPAAQGEISYVSWNSKVQHILASTSLNGITVVWDLKKQKPVISFEDSARRRCSVLQWHPDVATQLVVASDDDSSPTLRLWDMRNILSPVKEFVGHSKGVIAMSWCPNDSAYLLTCAKDNRTICWNVNTGKIVRELPAGTNWNFDVHWYPKIPGVISASSFDGKIGFYNIEGCDTYTSPESDFETVTLGAPKWYKRPGGVSFGFGGKLVSFHPRSSTGGSEVLLHNLVTEQILVSRSSEFESAIQNGEKSLLKALCEKKSQESESEDDRETWGFLKVMFEEDGTARTKMLTHLGFDLPIEEKEVVEEDISTQVDSIRLDDTATDKAVYESSKGNAHALLLPDDGEDFFNNLPSPKTDTPKSARSKPATENSELHVEEIEEEQGMVDGADPSFDDSVQRALVVGDYKSAVAQCIAAGKMADALVIAHVGGTSLWESTRDQYLKMSVSPYSKIVSAMVNNDLMSLVKTRPLKYWKETLALLCTFAQNEEWSLLCDSLASKLMAARKTLAATLCYICAGNIDKTVEIWSKNLITECDGKSYVELLQDLMEKTIVLALASGQKRFSASLCKLVEKYAEILASQGLLTTAMEYLKLLGTEELSPEILVLRERIALSTVPEKDEKATAFENSQQYVADQSSFALPDVSQRYYPETTSQVHQNSGSPYSENFQQTNREYVPHVGYQAASHPAYQPALQGGLYQTVAQPRTFIPSQVPQVPQETYTPQQPVNAQPAVRSFVPSNAPILKNAGQYQQPTLASQLYPVQSPNYQPLQAPAMQQGPVMPHMQQGPAMPHMPQGPAMPHMPQGPAMSHMQQVLAPTTAPPGYRPAVAQRPVINSMQPPSPTRSPPVQPAVAPPAPPPTIQTVDTSKVPAHHRAVITTLTRLFNETSEALGGSRANPARKREIEDNSKKIGALFAKLNSGDISKNASDKLIQLCQSLDKNDFSTALQIQVLLTTSEWDECNFWLATLKRMIKTRQGVGARS